MSGTSSSITRSPSMRPTLPSSNVTSFMVSLRVGSCIQFTQLSRLLQMRVANLDGRLTLVRGSDRAIDVQGASGGRFESDPQAIYDRWDEFAAWAADADGGEP